MTVYISAYAACFHCSTGKCTVGTLKIYYKGEHNMGQWMNGHLQRLNDVRSQNLTGGGEERLVLINSLGKLTARERIEKLVDAGSFEEIGSVVKESLPPLDGKKRPTPSDRPILLWFWAPH